MKLFCKIMIIISLVIIWGLCDRYLDNINIGSYNFAELLGYPFVIWASYLLISIFTNGRSETKSIIFLTLGVVASVFLTTTSQPWNIYVAKCIAATIGGVLLWIYIYNINHRR